MATTLTFGRYNGKTLEQIAAIDPGYLQWMAGESINRGGVNFSELAAQYLRTHEIEEPEVCPICHETSCGGPSEHQTRRPRPARPMPTASPLPPIDWRYIQFNLSTEEGQRGYQAYIRDRYTADDVLSWLDQHCRAQVIDESHEWIAEAIMRKTFDLGEPGPWKRGMRVDRPKTPPTLFI